jgi:hypothetical protein
MSICHHPRGQGKGSDCAAAAPKHFCWTIPHGVEHLLDIVSNEVGLRVLKGVVNCALAEATGVVGHNGVVSCRTLVRGNPAFASTFLPN